MLKPHTVYAIHCDGCGLALRQACDTAVGEWEVRIDDPAELPEWRQALGYEDWQLIGDDVRCPNCRDRHNAQVVARMEIDLSQDPLPIDDPAESQQ